MCQRKEAIPEKRVSQETILVHWLNECGRVVRERVAAEHSQSVEFWTEKRGSVPSSILGPHIGNCVLNGIENPNDQQLGGERKNRAETE